MPNLDTATASESDTVGLCGDLMNATATAVTLDHGDGFGITPPHSLQPITVQLGSVPACSNGTSWMTVGPVTAG